MYIDYINLLLQTYREMVESKQLSFRLELPSPAGLRDECVLKCRNRCEPRDERVLRDFFGVPEPGGTWIKQIEGVDIDKMRPVVNYLKGKVVEPGRPVVELVAWLIGFEPRPYDDRVNYEDRLIANQTDSKGMEGGKKPSAEIEEDTPVRIEEIEIKDTAVAVNATNDQSLGNNEVKPVLLMRSGMEADNSEEKQTAADKSDTPAEEPVVTAPEAEQPSFGETVTSQLKSVLFSKRIVLPGILFLIVMLLIYFTTGNTGQCMYWTGDHYESISCEPRQGDTVVIALDAQKMKYFRKIDPWDTITVNSINRIWYSKIRNKVEFFTARGTHPVNRSVTLKPMSEYIFITHVLPLRQMNQVSK